MSGPTEPHRWLRVVGADAGDEDEIDGDGTAAALAAGTRYRAAIGDWMPTLEQMARLEVLLGEVDTARGGISQETIDLRAIVALVNAAPAMAALLPELTSLVHSRVTSTVAALGVLLGPIGREARPRLYVTTAAPPSPSPPPDEGTT